MQKHYPRGWFFGGSDASVMFTARRDLCTAGRQLDPGAGDLQSERGEIDRPQGGACPYQDESVLIDQYHTYVRGGTTVFIIVSVGLMANADGRAHTGLHFFTGNF